MIEDSEFSGRLPNGEITTDTQLYIDKWRDIAEPMREILSIYAGDFAYHAVMRWHAKEAKSIPKDRRK